VILYQATTGELPFRGTSRMLLDQVLHEEPRPPRRLNDLIPRDLETICLKAMAKEPARRYASAAELADDLERSLRGDAIHARPVPAWERAVRWIRRRPSVALLSASIVLVALVGFTGVLIQWRRAETALGLAAEKSESERRANARLEQSLYYSSITLADRELAAGNPGAAQELLDRCPISLRGWEWYHLKRAPNHHKGILPGHRAPAWGIASSPDGRQFAAAYSDGVIRLWEAQTGREIRILRGHTGPVHLVAFSPDRTLLASTGGDGDETARIWEVGTGRPRHILRGHKDSVWGLAFSPDG
jgi:hypothetical protein